MNAYLPACDTYFCGCLFLHRICTQKQRDAVVESSRLALLDNSMSTVSVYSQHARYLALDPGDQQYVLVARSRTYVPRPSPRLATRTVLFCACMRVTCFYLNIVVTIEHMCVRCHGLVCIFYVTLLPCSVHMLM